jgi:glucokinase
MRVIAVDIGGTKIDGYLVDITKKPKVLNHFKVYTQAEDGKRAVLNNLNTVVEKINDRAEAISICIPGLVQRNQPILVPNIPCLNGVNIEKHLKSYQLPIILVNDGDAFTYAETLHGAGKKQEAVIGITVGTGVGGGLTVQNHLVANAMEIGHTTIVKDGKKCVCGNFGCLERYINANSIIHRYYKLTKVIMRPKEIFAEKSRYANNVLLETSQFFAAGLANVMVTVRPSCIVLGGGICKSKRFLSKTRDELKNHPSYASVIKYIPIHQTQLGDSAAAIGAALLHKA